MKVDKMLPKVYYSESRDFSYIGRIFEIALNYMKSAADLTGSDPNSDQVNSLIVDLLGYTLGFESKHKYITKDLIGVASTLNKILKYKGTFKSIETVVKALSASQGMSQELDVNYDLEDHHNIILIVPPKLTDLILLKDLFDYILPVGTCVTIEKAVQVDMEPSKLYYKDNIPLAVKISDDRLAYIVSKDTDLEIADGTRFINKAGYRGREESILEADKSGTVVDAITSLTYFGVVPGDVGNSSTTAIETTDNSSTTAESNGDSD